MYELIQVLNNTYYINCPAKIGLYLDGDKGVYLIDSGNDKEAGRKVRQILDKKAGRCARYCAPIPTQTTSAAANIFRRRPDARSMLRALSATLRATRCSSRRFFTAAFRRRRCGTSF